MEAIVKTLVKRHLILRGHAPNAEIGAYRSKNNIGSFLDYKEIILDDHTNVMNNSYVENIDGYTLEAKILDELISGKAVINGEAFPSLPQVWAAGNNGINDQFGDTEGYYSVFTSAKNTISVGSIDTRDGHLSDFSSLGPTLDGRIKPDLVAPGCSDSITSPSDGITAAKRNSQGYTGKCGTSMAAPVVTGIIALMTEGYISEIGLPEEAWAPTIMSSTYKAILIHTATDLVKAAPFSEREFNNPDTGEPVIYHEGPDFATGWGLVNADAATKVIVDETLWEEGEVSFQENDSDVQCFALEVPVGEDSIKVTIAWDDISAKLIYNPNLGKTS